MATPCSGCGESITDVSLDAFGLSWHPYCLGCNVCGKDFSDGSKVEEGTDGYAYCTKDYIATFSAKCPSCGEFIEGQTIEAMGKKWHPNHFVCGTCKAVLNGQFFPAENGIAYCEKHYYDAMGLLCADCEKPILSGKCIPFLDKKYHPEHFRCSHCKKGLVGKQYSKQNTKPYCKECHIALFG